MRLLTGIDGRHLVDEQGRRARRAVDRQVEDVETVIAADDVVHQLGPDALAKVDVGIDDAFLVDQRIADRMTVRVDDARPGAVRAQEQVAVQRAVGGHRRDDLLAYRRTGDDGEQLAFETMRGRANPDRFGHIIGCGRDGQRDIIGNVDELALRQQREACERVGILPARQRAERPDRRVMDADRTAVAARPGQLFGPGRHQLAVPPQQAAVGADDQVAVIKRADADRIALVDADDDRTVMVTRGVAQRRDFGTVDTHRRAIKPFVPVGALDRRHQPVPIGIGGNEHFGEGDELCPIARRFGDQRARLVDGARGVEENGRGLHRRNARSGQDGRRNLAHVTAAR